MMPRILIAEDSPTQALQIQRLLEGAGYEVEATANGRLALEALAVRAADLVLTDLEMPEMNGLALVETVRKRYPRLPVVLMTAFGSEEVAIQALQRGAASYVPKANLARDLVDTLRDVLGVARAQQEQERLADCLSEIHVHFTLPNDASTVTGVVSHLQAALSDLHLTDETERIRVGVALEAALHNAIYHGNLELTTADLRDAYRLEDFGKSYHEMLAQRRAQPPYCDRHVRLQAHLSRREAVFEVSDDGPGFDVSSLQASGDAQRLEQGDHRGWLLMRSFVDEVKYNARGNQVTLVKRAREASHE